MIATTYAAMTSNATSTAITVETDVLRGIPGIHIVGMGNKAVAEAAKRIRSALTHADLPLPSRKFTINLAPAELPKYGTQFDVAIAISLLVATKQLRQTEVDHCLFIGELSLGGGIRRTTLTPSLSEVLQTTQTASLFVPLNTQVDAVPAHCQIYAASTLHDLYLHLKGISTLTPLRHTPAPHTSATPSTFDDISGHTQAKRALALAIAGHHHTLLIGPPGVGKTALVEAAHSLLGTTSGTSPAFRAPPLSLTATQLSGSPRHGPGEVTRADGGILFLDELPEFSRPVRESLRTHLEKQSVTIGSTVHPAGCLIIAAMNPCPCGYYGSSAQSCRCLDWQRQRYLARLSGPLIDRFDIIIHLQKDSLQKNDKIEYHSQHSYLLSIVSKTKLVQMKRYKSSDKHNGCIPYSYAKQLPCEASAQQLLDRAEDQLNLSTRGRLKVLRLAQTIADFDEKTTIESAHIAEALQLRGNIET